MECTYEKLNVDKEKRRKYLMSNLRSKLDWLKLNTGHDIAYIGVCGSQNYGCDIYTPEYMSDVDAKAICIPSLEDLIRGKKMVSHTYVMDDNSHIDVKDIRLYMDLWKKANPSFLEILFTEFNIVVNDRFNQILDMADDIAKTIDADAVALIDYAREKGVKEFNEETYERLSDIIYQIIFSKCVEEIRHFDKRG